MTSIGSTASRYHAVGNADGQRRGWIDRRIKATQPKAATDASGARRGRVAKVSWRSLQIGPDGLVEPLQQSPAQPIRGGGGQATTQDRSRVLPAATVKPDRLPTHRRKALTTVLVQLPAGGAVERCADCARWHEREGTGKSCGALAPR